VGARVSLQKNIGSLDRAIRAGLGVVLIGGSILAGSPAWVIVLASGVGGALLYEALIEY
jgi:hypothetical protein